MSRNKYPLTTQTAKLFIVIRKNKEIPMSVIQDYCRAFMTEYSFIEHKCDIDPVTKFVIGTHYHIVGKSKKSKTPLCTHLNDLCRYFHFDNADGVQIDKFDDYVRAIQYLIHKNNPEKTQHDSSEIISNIPIEDLNTILCSDSSTTISFDYVYSVCYSSKNIVDVIKALGIQTYHKYRFTIRDIFEYTLKDKSNVLD